MGSGERRGGHRNRAHHHNRHHRRNHHHHPHHGVGFGALLYRPSGSTAHPLQRRMWSGCVMIMLGLVMFCYGIANVTISSRYGYSYQGTIFLGVGSTLALCGGLVAFKTYQLFKMQGANQQTGSAVFATQSGAGSVVQLQQGPPGAGVWVPGQQPPPPPGYGQQPPPPGYGQGQPPLGTYPPHFPPGVQPPPGFQPPYGQPAYGQPMYGQAPYPQANPEAPPLGPQPGPPAADGAQFLHVQPASQPTDQSNVISPGDGSQAGPAYPPSDAPPPSYDEATKTAQGP